MPDLHPMHQGQAPKSREERLELAYQELIAESHKVSGRALAERAHMHRSLCTKWLRIRQQIQSSSKTNNHTEGAPAPDDSDPLNQEELPS